MRILLSILSLVLLFSCETTEEEKKAEFSTPFEKSSGQQTATYDEVISFYLKLAKEYSSINVQTIGETDSGHPLHLVTFNPEGEFNFKKIDPKKITILVNNGIHPGEPDGIDATMLLFRDLANKETKTPKNTILTTIPIYNIGGALNRNSNSRANQNGPESYGFRGNALNYDLNRDFIKSDTKNSKTFSQIFHLVKPDIFIDNHVSNGADYQYTLTHLFTQHNKLGGKLGNYLHKELMPNLETELEKKNWDITPFVNVYNQAPEIGFSQFMDNPRYSTGYTTLWNTLGLMVETHMLKSYKKRVLGTYSLLQSMITISEKNYKKIKEIRKEAVKNISTLKHYPIGWEIDTLKNTKLNFKGFKADTLISEITGLPRLKYDRTKPFTKEVKYQNYYKATDSITVPKAYIIKKEWIKIVDLLSLNNIEYSLVEKDTVVNLENYRIKSFETNTYSYEGHYNHYNTTVEKYFNKTALHKGDYIIPTNQTGIRYIIETLEPACVDSFFNWNFFDTILQQKEHFSPYIFEDTAIKILEKDSVLLKEFNLKKITDSTFATNWEKQLNWLYKKSKYYEKEHLSYPVYRVLKED
ncbi:zinc carboxypeptidase [Maribacter vaceletii]|uniref:Zinc carboxypeptidase n=1 Tax=Maribacter vaceletii TaxID=1206816 RepID=A0A495DSB2_9FLAO|nr:M14 family metallopeptidase [Maribacter vaceletii]RKR06998.1 zinc carboxypeptidase [Maribacter vaceletii]